MSFLPWFTNARRRRPAELSTHSHRYVPTAESLEDRQCPSVAAPTGLHLTALSPTQVQMTWTDVAGEQGFRIEQWNGAKQVQIGTVGQHVTTFTATGLAPNTVQYFAIEAFDSATTAQGAWGSITTPANAVTAPSNVKVSNITLNQATLTWTAGAGQTGYKIFQWNGTTAVQVGSVAGAVTSFKLTNLPAGTTTYVYVQGFNATAFASSPWITVTTPAPQLTTPGNFQVKDIDSSTIGLSWTNVSAAAGYKVYEWNGVTGSAATLVATLAANTTGYQATGLAAGQMYWFYVQAYSGSAYANTAWASTTTAAAVPLTAPSSLTATETAVGTVTLNWVEPAGAVGYNVYVWTGYAWLLDGTVAAGTHQATISSLASNQTVWFLVQAFTANDAQVANSAPVFANV